MTSLIDIPSPHHRERRQAVDCLVLHAMAEWVIDEDGLYRHCTDYLRRIQLSVHAFCLPDGRIVSSVDPARVAFHAGAHNDHSVGMEVVVAGGHDLAGLLRRMGDLEDPPYTDEQYRSAGWWFRRQAEAFGLGLEHVTAHAALDPDRKHDPGPAFDLERFRQAFAAT